MIAEIITRLQSQVAALKLVAGAAEFGAAADTNPTASPAAYVLRLSEQGGELLTYARTGQRVATEIGITLALRNLADAKGAAANVDLEALRAAVRTALLGWSAPSCDPFEFAAGGLLAFRDGFLWWQDAYRTAYDITS